MPPCVAPTCHRTCPRKRPGQRTLPGKCVRPNPWHAFRTRVSGQGLSSDEISFMYNTWKQNWLMANPGLSRSDAKARMNETLCAEIDNINRLAQSRITAATWVRTRDERRGRARTRIPRPPGRFFAKKGTPDGWSLTAHIQTMTFLFVFQLPRRQVIQQGSVQSLGAGRWFKDDIINAYMALLSSDGNPGSRTSIFMNSFFFSRFTLTENTRLGAPDPRYVNQPPSVRHALVQRWTRNRTTDEDFYSG